MRIYDDRNSLRSTGWPKLDSYRLHFDEMCVLRCFNITRSSLISYRLTFLCDSTRRRWLEARHQSLPPTNRWRSLFLESDNWWLSVSLVGCNLKTKITRKLICGKRLVNCVKLKINRWHFYFIYVFFSQKKG